MELQIATMLTYCIFLFVYMLAAYGFAYIVGHSVLSRPFRERLWEVKLARWFVTLIECPMCLGFWMGMFVGGYFTYWEWIAMVAFGCFTTASNMLLGRLAGLLPGFGLSNKTSGGDNEN